MAQTTESKQTPRTKLVAETKLDNAIVEAAAAEVQVAASATVKPTAQTSAKAKASPIAPQTIPLKEKIMTATKTATEEITTKVKDAVADAQDRAKAAFEKGSEYAAEYGEFTKGNLEALVESGKIFVAGLQGLGKDYVSGSKSAFETMAADAKALAAVKTPADFIKLQGEILRRNFDAVVTTGSKQSEALVKLAGDAFAPISTRVSLAVDKVKQAA